jgi:hypothetical protein
MVLAYTSGWIIVPGAILGLWLALRRSATRLEQYVISGGLYTYTSIPEVDGLYNAQANVQNWNPYPGHPNQIRWNLDAMSITP